MLMVPTSASVQLVIQRAPSHSRSVRTQLSPRHQPRSSPGSLRLTSPFPWSLGPHSALPTSLCPPKPPQNCKRHNFLLASLSPRSHQEFKAYRFCFAVERDRSHFLPLTPGSLHGTISLQSRHERCLHFPSVCVYTQRYVPDPPAPVLHHQRDQSAKRGTQRSPWEDSHCPHGTTSSRLCTEPNLLLCPWLTSPLGAAQVNGASGRG